MSSGMRPSLKFLSLNVNGLRDARKRQAVFARLRSECWDIVALQETHHIDSDEGKAWAASGVGSLLAWPGVSFWSHGTSASRGVALLFRERCVVEGISLRTQGPDGRVLVVDFSVQGEVFSVVSVYAPANCGQQRCQFFSHSLLPVLPQGRHLLLGGDYNCVRDALLDQRGQSPSGSVPRVSGYTGGLDAVEAAHDLVDIWRERHPAEAGFTHVPSNAMGRSSARLDRWLVSSSLEPWCTGANIAYGWPTDHLGVSLVLHPPTGLCRGSGPWSFPLPLLHNEQFCAELEGVISLYLADHPVADDLTPALRWDGLKRMVRDHTQQYSYVCAQRRRARQRLLEGVVERAMHAATVAGDDPNALSAFQSAQAALQQYHQQEAGLAAMRAGVLDQHYGEQSTFWFYHLHNKRSRASDLHELRMSASGDPISLSTMETSCAAGEHLADAFSSDSPSGLFAQQPADSQAQERLLSSVSRRLSQDACQQCEGPQGRGLALEELEEAMQSMPRGKRPGSDGLPYEFYVAFWSVLASPLLQVFHDAFAAADCASLPQSMCMGLIVLLYKDVGDRALVSSYRPITLLNADYKIVAKALTMRFAAHLGSVIDQTQTAFLPGRWIADNVLCHMEEIDFLEAAQQPGCVVFLDFAKAFDRLDRVWVTRCMQALGFGPQAVRCVELMQTNTQAAVLFNGWRSPQFPVRAGLPQGSPLSPLLYVLAAQPLSSMLRQQAEEGLYECIRLPDGTPAPPCHQHADDTSLHVRTRRDAALALDGPVALYCAASNSRLNRSKSQGLLLGSAAGFEGMDTALGVPFVPHGGRVKHLGVELGRDMAACSVAMFDRLTSGLLSRVGHWSARCLSFLGRVHVAKQVLGSSLWYHAMFMRPSPTQLQRITHIITAFVAGVAPESGRRAALHPGRFTSSLDWSQGGVRLVDVDAMITALQAKLVARLLAPDVLPWKQFFMQWLVRSETCFLAHPALTRRPVDQLRYGPRLLFSTYALRHIGMPARQLGYLVAFQSLRPHRAPLEGEPPLSMLLHEPLFYSCKVKDAGGSPFTGRIALALAAAGVSTVGALISTPVLSVPEALRPAAAAVRACLPVAWQQPLLGSDIAELSDEQIGEAVPFDPGFWAIGQHVLPDYTVRDACDRCVLVRAMAQDSSLVPGQPLRPRFWVDELPSLGLEAGEASHGRAGSPAPVGTRLASQRLPDLAASERRVRPRPLPPRRVFDTALPDCAASPLIDADVDPLSPPDGTQRVPWSSVWRRLVDIELDRSHRVLAWRILHGSVYCGQSMLRARRTDEAGAACPHHCAAGGLQTILHLFIDCPLARAVWSWVGDIWVHVSSGSRPPITAAVLLADDDRAWRPRPKLAPLWMRLRLSVLHALWCAAGQARHGHVPASARTIAMRVLSFCRSLMVQHWFRVGLRRPQLGACPNWLMARNPALTLETFQDWWCASSVLCRVVAVAGAKPRMEVVWDAVVPVPLPAVAPPRHHPDLDLGEAMHLDVPDDFI